ncbi:hypothetical protein GLOTRDRAFT_130898 [Gloeophyllum trabeum ATCC 11539]|uniref:RlpA-like protein double-psi beta-barrel domain-containing protein n=1 Tax=Gloeophyllum trabeum (strain ATCC 11539 / FP-39264 / Madison 617) TaxID=670483 RepID=S7Q1Y8_GLOTA|nr:uncharacterized protein GLOTRDRAFT_130898 [Gloeophyllum trabeum ATCC 11539]EPQ53553.1 hypothetical protein GLOTRDRAFT_130898 [Gloeophyllum trabeum ATCC 11539]
MFISVVPVVSFLAVMAGLAQGSPTEFTAVRRNGTDLDKRVNNARMTYYNVGLGACGITNQPTDFVVALDATDFGSGYPGPHCFQHISITANGKTATAEIVDKCPGCPVGGLDLSEGLFSFFAPLSTGVIYGSWNYV